MTAVNQRSSVMFVLYFVRAGSPSLARRSHLSWRHSGARGRRWWSRWGGIDLKNLNGLYYHYRAILSSFVGSILEVWRQKHGWLGCFRLLLWVLISSWWSGFWQAPRNGLVIDRTNFGLLCFLCLCFLFRLLFVAWLFFSSLSASCLSRKLQRRRLRW